MELIDGMKVFLASNFTLYLKTHNAHFNVTGMFFAELHKLFQKQYEDLWENFDTIAEKIRQLDAFVPASQNDFLRLSLIKEFDGVTDARGYVERLMLDHERMIVFLNRLFKIAEAAGDQAVMNYIAERLDAHGKMRWMLRTTINPVSS
jgi:starvation-inducible DNA-binding protein